MTIIKDCTFTSTGDYGIYIVLIDLDSSTPLSNPVWWNMDDLKRKKEEEVC